MASVSTVDTLTRINLDDFFDSLGWTPAQHSRAVLEGLMWLPARRFAEHVATYDALVAERGLAHGAEWILKQYLRELQVAGRQHFPASGPALVLANHPGMADMAALFVALGRPDLHIVALERPFLRTLANTSRQLIYVPHDPAQRMPVARAVVAQLRAGHAVLTCPAGEIEPDPAVHSGAIPSLERWSDSVSLFARLAPETQIVPVIVSGVLHPAPQHHALLRLRRAQKDKEKLAAMLQILWRGYQGVTVRVAIGAPLPARELLVSGEPQRAVVDAARRLIEHPPTNWQTVVCGLR